MSASGLRRDGIPLFNLLEHSYANDKHLRRLASSSPLEGFVPIKEIMKFNRIKSMCTEKEEIVKALHLSSKLEIDCTNEYIRAVRHPRTSIKEEESPAHSTNTDDTKPILPLNIIVPEQILPNLLSFNSYHFVRPFLPVEAPQTRATEIRKEEAIPGESAAVN